MAVYAITNLGSSDWGDQADQAAQITSKIAQAAADAISKWPSRSSKLWRAT